MARKKKTEEIPAELPAAEVKERKLSYFAVDGNYGNAGGMSIMETTHWDADDWSIIENAVPEARPELSRAITESYEPGSSEEALRATFERLGVDLSLYEK